MAYITDSSHNTPLHRTLADKNMSRPDAMHATTQEPQNSSQSIQ